MDFQELTKQFCKKLYIPRRVDGHKGTFGKVLIIAGSEAYPGAGIMTTNGALRSGVGIVTLALLAGLIAGLAASKQCKKTIDAAALGVLLHSMAGEFAKNDYSENAMTIADVANNIPKAWMTLLNTD